MNKIIKEKNAKGITLIALVITIIVLLILAGISIAMLTGQNGILIQAQNSKTATKKAEVQERAKTDIIGVQTETQNPEINKTALKEILDRYFENVPDDIKLDTEITAKSEYGGSKMKVSDIYSGKIIGNGLTAADIANATKEEKQSIYGATVTGYTVPSDTTTDVEWKILYADSSNIYLIASNYIERNNIPNSTTEKGISTSNKPETYSGSSYKRNALLTNILGDYAGTSRITDNKLKALNNNYFNIKKYSSTNANMKAVAYMMDITAWNSKFLDSSKAEYTIGGPTIELLFNSYNEKYGTTYMAEATSELGYNIKKQEKDSWSSYISGMLTKSDNTQDPLYVIASSENANAMWVASPVANSQETLWAIYSRGTASNDYYSSGNMGFRPVVCLKNNVQLKKTGDFVYQIN